MITVADRAYQARIRNEALSHYSDGLLKCACCGATEDLSLDHINGDGAEHREELFGNRRQGGYRLFLWLRKNNWPEGYQVLCRPCNHSKAKTARCQLLHDGSPGLKRCSHPEHTGDNPLPLESFHKFGKGRRSSWCKACLKRQDPVRRPRKNPPPPPERTCESCSETFRPSRYWQRFCSTRCARKSARITKRA